MLRLTCFLNGRVQGVGMRSAIADLAREFPITGLVENLPDRRVKMVIEGHVDVLNAFIERLLEIAPGHIQNLDRFESPATGEFNQFIIQRHSF
ncbi:MAG: acylphosphatase [Planctomycetaceae bacterium]|jgi:acylphosphatase|nr:acylphosphatase [Planctomycetaceae bacterium]MCE2815248.1 acylphosphatase [Planctomycetaceae bacterium]